MNPLPKPATPKSHSSSRNRSSAAKKIQRVFRKYKADNEINVQISTCCNDYKQKCENLTSWKKFF